MNADAATVPVELLDVLQRCDQIAGHAAAVMLEYLEAEELGERRHARHPLNARVQLMNDLPVLVSIPDNRPDGVSLRGLELAGQDACHVRAMPEPILKR